MSSSYKGQDLFGSGPHTFVPGKQGQQTLTRIFFGDFTPGRIPIGEVEAEVVVRGRLVSSSEAGLWSQRDAIASALQDGQIAGDLVDLHGRVHEGMWFLGFEAGATERGRAWSVEYEALFVDVNES